MLIMPTPFLYVPAASGAISFLDSHSADYSAVGGRSETVDMSGHDGASPVVVCLSIFVENWSGTKTITSVTLDGQTGALGSAYYDPNWYTTQAIYATFPATSYAASSTLNFQVGASPANFIGHAFAVYMVPTGYSIGANTVVGATAVSINQNVATTAGGGVIGFSAGRANGTHSITGVTTDLADSSSSVSQKYATGHTNTVSTETRTITGANNGSASTIVGVSLGITW